MENCVKHQAFRSTTTSSISNSMMTHLETNHRRIFTSNNHDQGLLRVWAKMHREYEEDRQYHEYIPVYSNFAVQYKVHIALVIISMLVY